MSVNVEAALRLLIAGVEVVRVTQGLLSEVRSFVNEHHPNVKAVSYTEPITYLGTNPWDYADLRNAKLSIEELYGAAFITASPLLAAAFTKRLDAGIPCDITAYDVRDWASATNPDAFRDFLKHLGAAIYLYSGGTMNEDFYASGIRTALETNELYMVVVPASVMEMVYRQIMIEYDTHKVVRAPSHQIKAYLEMKEKLLEHLKQLTSGRVADGSLAATSLLNLLGGA